MSLVTRELIKQTEGIQEAQKTDQMYFIDKAMACCLNNDVAGAIQALKRLKLMGDALIVYRLRGNEIDWDDKSLCKVTQE